jgi:hypothetical protein
MEKLKANYVTSGAGGSQTGSVHGRPESISQTSTLKDSFQKEYKKGYQQALADVQTGVPEESESFDWMERLGHNTCRTAVLEHLDLLGKE